VESAAIGKLPKQKRCSWHLVCMRWVVAVAINRSTCKVHLLPPPPLHWTISCFQTVKVGLVLVFLVGFWTYRAASHPCWISLPYCIYVHSPQPLALALTLT
jgi:hypothetical protein